MRRGEFLLLLRPDDHCVLHQQNPLGNGASSMLTRTGPGHIQIWWPELLLTFHLMCCFPSVVTFTGTSTFVTWQYWHGCPRRVTPHPLNSSEYWVVGRTWWDPQVAMASFLDSKMSSAFQGQPSPPNRPTALRSLLLRFWSSEEKTCSITATRTCPLTLG